MMDLGRHGYYIMAKTKKFYVLAPKTPSQIEAYGTMSHIEQL